MVDSQGEMNPSQQHKTKEKTGQTKCTGYNMTLDNMWERAFYSTRRYTDVSALSFLAHFMWTDIALIDGYSRQIGRAREREWGDELQGTEGRKVREGEEEGERKARKRLIDFGTSSKTRPRFSDSKSWLAVSTVELVRQLGRKNNMKTCRSLLWLHLPPDLVLQDFLNSS